MPSRRHSLLVLTLLGLAACDNPGASPPQAPIPDPAPTVSKTAATPPPPVPADPDANAAPAAFQGEWNIDLAACGSAANESRLVIQPRRIRFLESSGPIDAVTAAGPREATFKVTLSAEGETVVRDYRFRLSPDGRTLTDLAVAFDRKRCPA